MIYYFNRYIGGVMMAEAACVVKASSFAGALRVAISLFRDCPGSVFPVEEAVPKRSAGCIH